MSIQAIAWAFKQPIRPAALKLVLIALADCTNDKEGMRLWPSIAHICEVTSLDPKTVKRYLVELKRSGLLVDTGERKGRTNQIKVYKLAYQKQSENGPVKEGHISLETSPNMDHVKKPKNGLRNPYKGTLTEPASSEEKGLKVVPKETADEILPARWQDLAEQRSIPEDQIFRSWRRFKDLAAFPYQLSAWSAWLALERVGGAAPYTEDT